MRLAYNPTQNRRHRHLVLIELFSDNRPLDDWSRAEEGSYSLEKARRHVRQAIRDGGFPEDFPFRVLSHEVSEVDTRRRSVLPVAHRSRCDDCERHRMCFRLRHDGPRRERWACVEECAVDAVFKRGWRVVTEKEQP